MDPPWGGPRGTRGAPMMGPPFRGPGPPPYGAGPSGPFGIPPDAGGGGHYFDPGFHGPRGGGPPRTRGGRGRGGGPGQLSPYGAGPPPPHPGGRGGGGGRRGRKRQHHPYDGLGSASLNELRQENRRKTNRHFGRGPPQPQPSPSPRIAPAAPHNDNAYLLSHHQSGGAFIDAVARTPTKDPLSTMGGRLTPSNYVPGEYWASGFDTIEDREAAEVEDAEALGHAGASMGLLGYLGPASDASDDDSSDHGLSEESEDDGGMGPSSAGGGGGGAVAALRHQVEVQAGEIGDLQERVADLMEKVHDLREGRREAEDRLAWALERLRTAQALLAEKGVEFEASPDAGRFGGGSMEEEVNEGGGGGGVGAGVGATALEAAAAGGGEIAAGVRGTAQAVGDGRVPAAGGSGAGPRLAPADSARSMDHLWGGAAAAAVTGAERPPRRSGSDWSEVAGGVGEGGGTHGAAAMAGHAAAESDLRSHAGGGAAAER